MFPLWRKYPNLTWASDHQSERRLAQFKWTSAWGGRVGSFYHECRWSWVWLVEASRFVASIFWSLHQWFRKVPLLIYRSWGEEIPSACCFWKDVFRAFVYQSYNFNYNNRHINLDASKCLEVFLPPLIKNLWSRPSSWSVPPFLSEDYRDCLWSRCRFYCGTLYNDSNTFIVLALRSHLVVDIFFKIFYL